MPADAAMPSFRLEDLLAEGRDPPSTIVHAASALPDGATLVFDAPADPVPLRRLLDSQGLEVRSVARPDGRWHLHVRRVAAGPARPPCDDSRGRFGLEDGFLTLDLRRLPPPRPMMEIRRVLDGGLAGGELIVRVPHLPVHLFDELEERGWRWDVLGDDLDGTGSGVAVLLTRQQTP